LGTHSSILLIQFSTRRFKRFGPINNWIDGELGEEENDLNTKNIKAKYLKEFDAFKERWR
jgi:hypothetical protein